MTPRPPQEGANFIGRFLRRLADYVSRLEREQREAYLAGATDIYDLERRMCELEIRQGSDCGCQRDKFALTIRYPGDSDA